MSREFTETLQVEVYVDPNGSSPFEEWIESLVDRAAAARIRARLARVRLGNLGERRAVGEGVSELKFDFGPGYRIYFGQRGRTLVVLLCGGEKKHQGRDIARAKSHWADYRRRSDETES